MEGERVVGEVREGREGEWQEGGREGEGEGGTEFDVMKWAKVCVGVVGVGMRCEVDQFGSE